MIIHSGTTLSTTQAIAGVAPETVRLVVVIGCLASTALGLLASVTLGVTVGRRAGVQHGLEAAIGGLVAGTALCLVFASTARCLGS